MKRLQLFVCLLSVFLVVTVSAQSQSQPQTGSMLELCYNLWKKTGFGWDEKRTERAAWVVRNEGRFEWQEWPDWEERNTVRWVGPPPEGAIAVVHTHPNNGRPEPSKQDAKFARELNIPVYTISGSGIWSVGTDGEIRQEAGRDWHKKRKQSK